MPSVVEMCVRVLDSHIICEEEGSFTPSQVVMSSALW